MFSSHQQYYSEDSPTNQFLDNNFASEVAIKQETSRGKENASPTSESSPLDDGLDDAERQKARRANQNLACRNYRRRKKEYVNELEGRIQKLEAENDQLRKENSAIKKSDSLDSIDPHGINIMNEMKQILDRLDDAVKNNMDDRSLSYLLQIFFLATEKRHIAHEKEVDKLVDPLTQAKLATLGYVPSLENPVIAQMYGPAGEEWWETYSTEAGITPQQSETMQEMRERLWKIDGDLRVERTLIDKQIKDFYLTKLKLVPSLVETPNSKSTNLDMAEVVEFARQLNNLKKNFTAQRTLILEVQCQLTKILQPRQHAILMLKINQSRAFDWPRHMQTLKSAWQLFSEKPNGTPSPTVLSLLNQDPIQSSPTSQYIPSPPTPSSPHVSPTAPTVSHPIYPQSPTNMHATIIQNNYIQSPAMQQHQQQLLQQHQRQLQQQVQQQQQQQLHQQQQLQQQLQQLNQQQQLQQRQQQQQQQQLQLQQLHQQQKSTPVQSPYTTFSPQQVQQHIHQFQMQQQLQQQQLQQQVQVSPTHSPPQAS